MLLLLAIFKFAEASFDSTRALLYRVAYAFSPIQFSGTLLFIYAVKLLFEDVNNQGSDSESNEDRQKATSQPDIDSRQSTGLDDDYDLVYPASLSRRYSSSESTL
jgi:hypothetical protein